jgi:hypothetical protein
MSSILILLRRQTDNGARSASLVCAPARERISVSMVRTTTTASALAADRSVIPRAIGVVGCLAVTAIHIIDQGGVPGLKEPEYIRVLYYVLEAAGVVAATLLLTRYGKSGWFLALGVAAGPILGYVLSRGPGLPNYDDDIGNWTEPLGVISLVVEGILLIIAAAVLATARRST